MEVLKEVDELPTVRWDQALERVAFDEVVEEVLDSEQVLSALFFAYVIAGDACCAGCSNARPEPQRRVGADDPLPARAFARAPQG